jgi:hypothetical protein
MTTNIYKFAPPGIDFRARREWVIHRRSGRKIRHAIAELRRVHAFEPDLFLFASCRWISGLEKSLLVDDDTGRTGRSLCRLARAYARRFHRDLVNELLLVRVGARRALLEGVACPILAS